VADDDDDHHHHYRDQVCYKTLLHKFQLISGFLGSVASCLEAVCDVSSLIMAFVGFCFQKNNIIQGT